MLVTKMTETVTNNLSLHLHISCPTSVTNIDLTVQGLGWTFFQQRVMSEMSGHTCPEFVRVRSNLIHVSMTDM